MLKALLLIGGCPRSGTTALLQVLNSNPHAFVSSEENLLSLVERLDKVINTKERRKASLKSGMRSLSSRVFDLSCQAMLRRVREEMRIQREVRRG